MKQQFYFVGIGLDKALLTGVLNNNSRDLFLTGHNTRTAYGRCTLDITEDSSWYLGLTVKEAIAKYPGTKFID